MLRTIRHRTTGQRYGPITRLVSPGDLGEALKPFVFLDFIHADIQPGFGFAFHPHSGLATLTYQLDCDVEVEDTSGQKALVRRGGLEWMQAGGGVWHRGTLTGSTHVTGFQLWVALPEGLEDAPAQARYVEPEEVPSVGNVRVLLGAYGGRSNPIAAPGPIVYLHVRIAAGGSWRIDLPSGFDVAWAVPFEGDVRCAGQAVAVGELAILTEGDGLIELTSDEGAQLVFGAARRHPYPLVLGDYSVHTNAASLARGEQRIRALGDQLTGQRRR